MDRFLVVGDIFKLPNKGIILSDIPKKYVIESKHEDTPGAMSGTFQEVDIGVKVYEAYKADGTKNSNDKYDKNKIKGDYICTSATSSDLYPEGTLEEGESNLSILYFTAKKLDDNTIIAFYQQDNLPEAFLAIVLPEDVKLV